MLHSNKKKYLFKNFNTPSSNRSQNHFCFNFTSKLLHAMFCMAENNQQSDKKEILINNQDKTYKSMKNFKRQQLLFTKTRIESEVSLKILSHE